MTLSSIELKSSPNGNLERVAGLDALRFLAALWVVFSHAGAFPLTEGFDRTSAAPLVVQGIWGNLFAGVPAVTVFFVISGFCVHYSQRASLSLKLAPFLVRRYVRIAGPLSIAVLLAVPLEVNFSLFHNSILWSLAAELIYYTLYPLILWARVGWGWNGLLVGAFVSATIAVLTEPRAPDYTPFGLRLNWLICLPSWLMGCRLAEVNFADAARMLTTRRIWLWRAGIWFLLWTCSVLRFHSPVGYPWTMNLFAIAVFYWLREEIIWVRHHGPCAPLEWAGQWSYSIYLAHQLARTGLEKLHLPNLGFNLNWCVQLSFILLASYAFYRLVELPAHHLARRASRAVTGLRQTGS